MPEKKLAAALEQLHEEISQTDRVDPETVELLKTAAEDVRELLARSDRSEGEAESIQARLRDLLVQSELEHPSIVGLIRKLADGLANLGI